MLYTKISEYLKLVRQTFKLVQSQMSRGRDFRRHKSASPFRRAPSRRNNIRTPVRNGRADLLQGYTKPRSKIDDILQTVSQILHGIFPNGTKAYEHIDTKKLGYISVSILRTHFENLGVPITVINHPSFLQYLQTQCPQRLLGEKEFIKMFWSTQFDNEDNSGCFDRERPQSNMDSFIRFYVDSLPKK
eukprot:UN31766